MAWALLTAAVAAGCMSYAPKPIDVVGIAASHEARSIDLTAVREELARIAPDYDWQGRDWNTLTLLAAALTTSPALARARATVDAAQDEAAAARVAPGPSFVLTAEYAFDPPESSNWLYGIVSDVLIDRGGRRQGRIESADVAARQAQFEYAASVWSVRMGIRRALDATVASELEASVASGLVAARVRQFDAVSRRVGAGEISRLELDRARADLATSRQAALDARARVSRARIDLAAAIGVTPAALDAAGVVVAPKVDVTELPALAPAAVGDALPLRAEILQATAAYDQSEAALRVAVANQFPEVRIGPGYVWERGLSKLPFNLSLSLPSSDRAHAAIAAAEARRAEAGKQLEAAVAVVESSISQADADYRAAFESLALARTETLPSARSIAEQADRELDAGAINRADWAAAQAGLLAAKLDEATALGGVLDAEAALEDALRRPLRGPETRMEASLSPFRNQANR